MNKMNKYLIIILCFLIGIFLYNLLSHTCECIEGIDPGDRVLYTPIGDTHTETEATIIGRGDAPDSWVIRYENPQADNYEAGVAAIEFGTDTGVLPQAGTDVDRVVNQDQLQEYRIIDPREGAYEGAIPRPIDIGDAATNIGHMDPNTGHVLGGGGGGGGGGDVDVDVNTGLAIIEVQTFNIDDLLEHGTLVIVNGRYLGRIIIDPHSRIGYVEGQYNVQIYTDNNNDMPAVAGENGDVFAGETVIINADAEDIVLVGQNTQFTATIDPGWGQREFTPEQQELVTQLMDEGFPIPFFNMEFNGDFNPLSGITGVRAIINIIYLTFLGFTVEEARAEGEAAAIGRAAAAEADRVAAAQPPTTGVARLFPATTAFCRRARWRV